MNFDLEPTIILKVLAGSNGYGTNIESSDEDFRGICIPPLDVYIGLQGFDQYNDSTDDYVIYSINKFFKLALENNPNILEIIFSDSSKIIHETELGTRLIGIRHEFLSKRCFKTFSGYAMAQLHRMKNHKMWIDNPIEKPNRADYGLPACPTIAKNVIQGMQGVKFEYLQDQYRSYFSSELAFMNAMAEYEKYDNWVQNRNSKRFELESKYQYDTKHAMHLIRLLKMGIEILRDGELLVLRPDASELKDIRAGKLTYIELMELADALDVELKYEYNNSKLPESPNYKKLNKFMITMIKEMII